MLNLFYENNVKDNVHKATKLCEPVRFINIKYI